ncbi:MAG: HAMP domain-containing histidine kinase [Iphinoe sp. HA4291-MV1]|jgi:signal transduction histidine kinase|nr:HAMP domain-containing histidine kinase [Iphinoe sp. HA4291-MV1]
MAKTMLPEGWRKTFHSVRVRLLVWYFLLTACTATFSIQATRQIYYDDLKARADASLIKEVERFQLLARKHSEKKSTPTNTTKLFDKFLSHYAPTRNEYIITLINDKIYKYSPILPTDLLEQCPTLLRQWTQLKMPKSGYTQTSTLRIRYVAQPVNVGGERGTLIAIHDASAAFQAGTNAISLVMQVTLIVLLIFFLLAWVTAGRVLYPLRLLTKAAHSITGSDMTQRIPVKGSDEIAELTKTFNEMLDRLQFAFDSQQKFLNDASHELRTPITVIQGHLEMLQFCPERQQQVTIALVMDELDRMCRLVNDLLLLARTKHPDFLRLKPEELDWLTEEIYQKARFGANRDWQLEVKGFSPIMVDRQRLTQAVMNLVLNAVRHTRNGDTITLGSCIKGDYAYIWVSDTGEGIAPEDQKRIFERFVQATKGDQQLEGHGLGLAIVQAIAQAHDGWIELSSRLGHGSTFTIVIPLASCVDAVIHESDSHRRRQFSHYRLSRNRVAGARLYNGHRH